MKSLRLVTSSFVVSLSSFEDDIPSDYEGNMNNVEGMTVSSEYENWVFLLGRCVCVYAIDLLNSNTHQYSIVGCTPGHQNSHEPNIHNCHSLESKNFHIAGISKRLKL